MDRKLRPERLIAIVALVILAAMTTALVGSAVILSMLGVI